jgi:prepilin peptidase CpaA
MTDSAALVLFPALMAYAAWSDLFTMTIANWISMVLVAVFVALAVASGMPLQSIAVDHLSCGLAVLVITFALFVFGWIGGGDAKLAAATAVWIGWPLIADYGLLASVIGAALTFSILFFRKWALGPRFAAKTWIARLHDRKTGVPYGIALACAGLTLYPETSVWHAVVGV